MTIRLTNEMTEAYARGRLDALGVRRDDVEGAIRHGLRAVLAIVERDLPDVEALVRGAYERGQSDERALTQLLGPPGVRRCSICKRVLDVPLDSDSLNCGGDCRACVREAERSIAEDQDLQETYPGSGIYE